MFHFGVCRDKPTRREAKRMETIARKHGADLVEAKVPGDRYLRWFEAQNRGEPFNGATAKAVLEAVYGPDGGR